MIQSGEGIARGEGEVNRIEVPYGAKSLSLQVVVECNSVSSVTNVIIVDVTKNNGCVKSFKMFLLYTGNVEKKCLKICRFLLGKNCFLGVTRKIGIYKETLAVIIFQNNSL